MDEVWKDIKGYEGLYRVSNFGNIKSLHYKGGKNERLLTPKTNNDGYKWVQLYGGNGSGCFLIHRLVGQAFVDNPNNLPFINHKDENPSNNHFSNLEWCTHLYNVRYSVALHPERKREIRKPHRNKKIEQYDKNGSLIRVWDNPISIKHETGWNEWHIEECCKGNRKTAKGYIWRYANLDNSGRETAL